jgi:hypothetical protein
MHNVSFRLRLGNYSHVHWRRRLAWVSQEFWGVAVSQRLWRYYCMFWGFGLNGFRYATLLHRAPSVSISQFTRNIAHNRVASAFSGTPSAEIHVHS